MISDNIIILLCVIPFQLLLFCMVFWCQRKFDKYETIALSMIANFDGDYDKYAAAMQGGKVLPRDTPAHIIRAEYKKATAKSRSRAKTALIENSIRAISHTLHNRVDSIGLSKISEQLVGDIDDNPLTCIALDLLAGAWACMKKEN